jgi:hypothetical protein
MVTKSGFESEEIDVFTDDGYILLINRIVNRTSFDVVYFQHGIMDNSVTWVIHGPTDGIAYQAYESGSHPHGCDVFMGNFRGNYPRRLAAWRRPETYWHTVSVLDYAQRDIPAFMRKIRAIKL